MIDQATLFTYMAVLLGFVFMPGPATLMTLARASSSGTRIGVATALGIAAGDFFHTVMAVVGMSAIILTSAFLFGLIKYMGAAYLVYLGLKAIFEKVEYGQPDIAKRLTLGMAFRQAVLAEILNPKSALFFLAFLPQFVKPENGSVSLQLMVLGILFILTGLLSTLLVAMSAGSVGSFLRRYPVVLRQQGKVVGGIYCGLGLRLALQDK
ncbi:MAG: LysE family translocator [Cyanobacteria bacterium J06627_32]